MKLLKGGSMLEWWSQQLKSDEPREVTEAARNLGKSKDPRAFGLLEAALKKRDRYVRMVAASALGEIRDARAVRPLIDALTDEEDRVSIAAAYALDKIKPYWWRSEEARVVPSLIAALKKKD